MFNLLPPSVFQGWGRAYQTPPFPLLRTLRSIFPAQEPDYSRVAFSFIFFSINSMLSAATLHITCALFLDGAIIHPFYSVKSVHLYLTSLSQYWGRNVKNASVFGL